jgi:hypothetical protein
MRVKLEPGEVWARNDFGVWVRGRALDGQPPLEKLEPGEVWARSIFGHWVKSALTDQQREQAIERDIQWRAEKLSLRLFWVGSAITFLAVLETLTWSRQRHSFIGIFVLSLLISAGIVLVLTALTFFNVGLVNSASEDSWKHLRRKLFSDLPLTRKDRMLVVARSSVVVALLALELFLLYVMRADL